MTSTGPGGPRPFAALSSWERRTIVATVPGLVVGAVATLWGGQWWWVSVSTLPVIVTCVSRGVRSARVGARLDAWCCGGVVASWIFGLLGGVTGWIGWFLALYVVVSAGTAVVSWSTRKEMRRFEEWDRTWKRRLGEDGQP